MSDYKKALIYSG